MKLRINKHQQSNVFSPITSYILLGTFIALTLITTYFLYFTVQQLFKYSLQQKLLSMAATASIQFDANELHQIQGKESVGTKTYEKIVLNLQKIRVENPDIVYLYILRKTNDPNIFEFVADADSLHPDTAIDLNNDGEINEQDQLNFPGDEYDVTEFNELRENGFLRSTVDQELAVDQWGTFLSSSSPIKDMRGFSDQLIGMDVDVSQYLQVINRALTPFLLFIAFLLLVLISQTVFLVRMWNSRVEFVKDLDRQKDELLGIVSHQLAAPVTSIKWYLEMLQDGDLGALQDTQRESISTMQNISVNLADLISMILDVSRIQLGRMKLTPQPLDLSQFFKEILDVIEPKAKEKKMNFEKNVPSKLPIAMLDKRYTRMTIENLLTNAIKYTPEKGTVQLKVELKDGKLRCEVKDTGYGIPKSEQEKIFGKLFRASNVRNTVDGNGFGLYVAKGAIEAQGGKIWFESEENKGTSFIIELPLVAATNSVSPAK